MAAVRVIVYRPRRFRSRYGRGGDGIGKAAGIVAGIALASAVAHSATSKAHAPVQAQHGNVTAAVTGGSEEAFMTAALADLGAPATAANIGSLEAWVQHETPWPPVAAFNPMNTTLTAPGSWNFNTFDGNLHVQAYPSAAEGAQANAQTLENGYPGIVSALRGGGGICGGGFAGEFSKWSGGGYEEVC